jgi:hypothetical protein
MAATINPLAHLTAARALLADPKDWTAETSGRTADGKPDRSEDLSGAVCFCSLGALWRISGRCGLTPAEDILTGIVRTTTPFDNIVSFNDDPATTHADILRVFDAAIARATQE